MSKIESSISITDRMGNMLKKSLLPHCAFHSIKNSTSIVPSTDADNYVVRIMRNNPSLLEAGQLEVDHLGIVAPSLESVPAVLANLNVASNAVLEKLDEAEAIVVSKLA